MPAMSCSLYNVILETSLENLRLRLENINLEEPTEAFGEPYTLRTIISDLYWGVERDLLWGTLSFETLQVVPQISGRPTCTLAGNRVRFCLFHGAISLYLAIFANRGRAEKAATKMNHVLTRGNDVPSQIVFNRRISTTILEQFLNNHPHTKKMCGWRDLDFVGVSKSSLHGANLDQFDHTREYDSHGSKRYIMVELHDIGTTIRISDEGIVTFFGNVTEEDALGLIRNEIISLLD